MKIKFESSLDYQNDAINAIVDIFKGQEACTSSFTVFSPEFINKQGLQYENETGVGNKLVLTQSQILENVQKIQLKNGLRPAASHEIDKENLDFSVEMETGTGKTYVYLKTIMEMNRQYGFSKFIIVVPSIPIKEGVYKSLQMTLDHFREHFPENLYNEKSFFIYDSSDLASVRDFALENRIKVMVINIQAFSKDIDDTAKKGNRVILDYNDRLGYRPISLLQNTRPIVIVDEPQSTMSSALQKKSVKNLHPLAVVRYSATHTEKINLMYKLDAVDAYNQQLVKQIEVASVQVSGAASSGAYIKLLSLQNKKGISAKVELDVKQKDGKAKRKTVELKKNADLQQETKLPQYADYFLKDIYVEHEYIEFTNGTEIALGNSIGEVDDLMVKRHQIRKTIEEHLDKEIRLNPKRIKVLSLFFIDAVKHYRIYDEDGNEQLGDYARIFEEEYKKLIVLRKYQSLFQEIKDLDTEVSLVHNGYFSIDKKAKASNKKEKFEFFKDTSGAVKADEDTYNLIMKDKEKLLSFDSKLRFIFSHSALKEGWDNPNVFQICTLKEAGSSETRRRQEIGRGLRLAVNQAGERVYGFETNTLTVMASESYQDFVDNLQKEIEQDTGIKFGVLQDHSFGSVVVDMHGNEPVYLGHEKSKEIFDFFLLKGYINKTGKIQDLLKTDILENQVDLGQEFESHIKEQILKEITRTAGKINIKSSDDKITVKLNKHVFLSDEFKSLWDKIKFKTTYSVDFDSQKLINTCISHIDARIVINGGKVIYNKGKLTMCEGGLLVKEEEISYDTVKQEVHLLPDIIGYLQNETRLTRKSIAKILQGVSNLNYFKVNPQKYIEGCIDVINEAMRMHIVDGIVYKKMGDQEYYSQQLFENEELTGYLKSNAVESSKSPYEYTVYDSNIEMNLATEFEKNKNVKVYAKLPDWFKIDTPLGKYNPDWAVLFEIDCKEELYFVVESKGTLGYEFLRPSEKGKIDCGKKHFEELAKGTGYKMKLEYVTNNEEFVDKAMSIFN
ncbi:type III restriction-modification system endonuclease [Chryseobacterium sp.]|uniref:type III restriction-modification system endonuclease n=1 Tax=Chryseobacterium sp. TaxID=1871047 RepID=UPI0012A92A20|nr:DEAD/DEAH box helicase family protein [Chryseobacterium sp.]QFG53544.1 type III restriction endonuclease subunit R [Chryseobacterium sp.]